jgi:hypothetical protein
MTQGSSSPAAIRALVTLMSAFVLCACADTDQPGGSADASAAGCTGGEVRDKGKCYESFCTDGQWFAYAVQCCYTPGEMGTGQWQGYVCDNDGWWRQAVDAGDGGS